MKKTLFLLLVIVGCSQEKSKPEDLEKIKSLTGNIATLEKDITELKLANEGLKEILAQNTAEEEKYEEEFNAPLYLTTYRNLTSSREFNFETSPTDEYWNRTSYFTSKRSNESFYNVRVSLINNELRFYFIGIQTPLEEGNIKANLYELDENKELHTIDEIDLAPGFIRDESEPEMENLILRYFMIFQLDNLVIKDDKLYYHKIEKIEELGEAGLGVSNKRYYEYTIGSKNKPLKLERELGNLIYSNIITFDSSLSHIISPDKSTVVVKSDVIFNDSQFMSFHKIEDWEEALTAIFNFTEGFFMESPKTTFDLEQHFAIKDYGYFEPDVDDKIIFGGMSWHTSKNILYLDDHGGDYKSIWQIDFDNDKVSKIIPGNEAIHPFFFKINEKEYITYVEGNMIMIAESLDNEEEVYE